MLGIDLQPVEPIAGAELHELDFLAEGADAAVRGWLGGPADVVLSDMAAPASGHPQTDHLRITASARRRRSSRWTCWSRAAPSSPRCWRGGADAALVAALNRAFAKVEHMKPPASRKDSSEKYLVATGFRGRPAGADAPDAARVGIEG